MSSQFNKEVHQGSNLFRSWKQDNFILPRIVKSKSGYFVDDKPARAESCRIEQKKILIKMNLDPTRYGLHSGKVGGVKALRDAGCDWRDISDKVGWSVKSSMPERYGRKSLTQNIQMDNKIW